MYQSQQNFKLGLGALATAATGMTAFFTTAYYSNKTNPYSTYVQNFYKTANRTSTSIAANRGSKDSAAPSTAESTSVTDSTAVAQRAKRSYRGASTGETGTLSGTRTFLTKADKTIRGSNGRIMPYIPTAEQEEVNYSNNDARVISFLKKFKEAEHIFDHWKDKYEEAYEYTMPQRESFYEETIGERRTDKIFDETAVVGIQEFASRLQAGIVPTFGRWASLQSGTEIPEDAKSEVNEQLDKITEYIFEVLSGSNFNQEVHEAFMDLAIGTAVLLVEEGDSINPINFQAVPLPRVVLNNGPDQKIDQIFRTRTMRYDRIMVTYPKAEMSEEMLRRMEENPSAKVKIVEGVFRLYDKPNEERYKYCVVCMNDKEMIYETELTGVGSNPYIVFRWNKASGEVYGRGPVFNAMAAIKTTNLTVELILQNAQMSISGIYTFEDDGVINPDNISLVPGSLIPVAPNSRGLQALPAAGRFDVAQLVLGDMRNNIKKALYMETLGRPEGTPMTATEVSERMADLSRQIGSSFGRLQSELNNSNY